MAVYIVALYIFQFVHELQLFGVPFFRDISKKTALAMEKE